MKISGTFNVDMQPEEVSFVGVGGINFARMSLNKTFEGPLNAHSQGEMLSAVTGIPGSAGYVAIEQVTGHLSGKKGGFVLQHSGIMNQGEAKLTLQVVPDSGSAELQDLNGHMAIKIENGVHYYEFEYSFN